MMTSIVSCSAPGNTTGSSSHTPAGYGRQLILPEFGPSGQQRLQRTRVLVVGLGGGWLLGLTLRRLLFGVEPMDPMVTVAAATLCLLASVLACLFPAWRATRVDPVRAVVSD